MIPDSTRVFFGYLLGAPDYKDFTWEQVVAAPDDAPIVNPPLNEVETLASSADDFVSFYSRALQGEFFKNPETLQEFRRILALGDVIYLIPIPLGINAFAKGGSIDVPGHHALCVAGGMFVWVEPVVGDPRMIDVKETRLADRVIAIPFSLRQQGTELVCVRAHAARLPL